MPTFQRIPASALCRAAAMLPRGYIPEHPTSALLQGHAPHGQGTALGRGTQWCHDPLNRSHVQSDTCLAGAQPKPTAAQSTQQWHDWRTQGNSSLSPDSRGNREHVCWNNSQESMIQQTPVLLYSQPNGFSFLRTVLRNFTTIQK